MQKPERPNESSNELTLMVLGRKAGPPLRFNVAPKTLKLLLLLVLVGLCGLVALVLDFVNTKFDEAALRSEKSALLAQNARLSERGAEKDRQLALLSDKMRSIELTLERVQEMEGQVRLMTGMPESEGPLITERGPQTPRLGEGSTQSDIAQTYASARDLMDRMEGRRLALKKVARYFFSQRSEIMQIPNKWPLRGWVTSLFGIRTSPFTGKPAMHNGIDIAAPEGAVIRAPAAGQVIFVGEQGGYGNVLAMQHGRGITTLYGHLVKALVQEGMHVPSNTPIALVGNTGRSTGPHLHYEVRLNNIPINPSRFLPVEESPSEEEPASPGLPQAAPSPMPTWPSEALPAVPIEPISPIPPTTQIEPMPQ